MDTEQEKVFIELGLAPGAALEFYQPDDIAVDTNPYDEMINIGDESITLSNKYENYIWITSKMYRARNQAMSKVNGAMRKEIDNGAFKMAANTASQVIAETIKAVTSVYLLDPARLSTLAAFAKKTAEDLDGFVSATYDHYLAENEKIQLEKATREQAMNAESIARASEVKSVTTTTRGKTDLSGSSFGRSFDTSYGGYSYGDVYGGGRTKTETTTTFTTGMYKLSDELEANSMASANIEINDQIHAKDHASESVSNRCLEAINTFYDSFLNILAEAHPTLLAIPNKKYQSTKFWIDVIKQASEQDVDTINKCMKYYHVEPETVWNTLLADEIYAFLEKNHFKGTYEDKYLNYYLKALGLQELKPFKALSNRITEQLASDYDAAYKISEVDSDSAAKLLEIKATVKDLQYLNDDDRMFLTEMTDDAKKAVSKQRRYTLRNLIHIAIAVLGYGVAAIFIAVPCIKLLDPAVNVDDLDGAVDEAYIAIVGVSCLIAGTAVAHYDYSRGFFLSLLRGVGSGILGVIALFLAILIVGLITGRIEQ